MLALLTLVAAQVITGLFSNDDIAFSGPLADWISRGASEQLTGWHEQIFDALAGFMVLHILAIVFYLVVRRSNLVAAMITGNKPVPGGQEAAIVQRLTWQFIAAAFIAATISWLIFRSSPPVQAEPATVSGATADW